MRITQQIMSQSTLNNIENNMTRINQLEGQISSGQQITKPSDDPIGTAQAISFQEGIDQSTQFLTNISQASSWLNQTDSALASVSDAIQRARELAVQAANGTMSSDDRTSVDSEIQQLQQQVLGLANTKDGSSYLFAGTKSDAPGFTSANPITYQGNAYQVVRQVAPGQTVAVNVDASATFNPVFTALNNLHAGLTANNGAAITSSIDDLDTALTAVMTSRSTVGAKINRMGALQGQMSAVQTNMTGLLSNTKD